MCLRKGLFLITLIFSLSLTGCTVAATGRAKVQQDSFGQQKKFAIVTISSAKEFYGERGLSQNFKKKENVKGLNTQPVIDQLAPLVHSKFSKTGYFTMVPTKNVVESKNYLSLEEDEKVQKVAFFSQEMNIANRYKYFVEPQKCAQLARDLKVDGVITVLTHFSVDRMKSGFHLGPFNFGKTEYVSVATMTVTAYDKNGDVLWRDTSSKHAEPGDKKAIVVLDLSDISGTNFEKMHPSAVLVGEHVADVLVQRFRDTMEGKKTSIFQRAKDKDSKQATTRQL